MRSTQKIFLNQSKPEPEFSPEFISRQEKIAERNALHWLYKSEIDVDRAMVLKLHEKPLRRYWKRCGYSQEWIDKQFAT